MNRKPPFRYIMPGRVYRNEEISARSYCLFHQIEGLYVDENVSFSDLKEHYWLSPQVFDEKTRIKSALIFPIHRTVLKSMWSVFMRRRRLQHLKSGWLESVGAGMVHP